MEPMTVRVLLAATDGTLWGVETDEAQTITNVVIDSRAAQEGDLFVALRGERTDGHRYIAAALEQGAAGCLTEEEPEDPIPGKFFIQVPSTMRAIGQVAKAYRDRFNIPVIGVTGSVGKTTTKDMIASVLGERFQVLKTDGNFNNELGLPLTLFRLTSKDEICVLEMGMNHFGEIDYLTQIVCPDVAVITNIGDAHIENLGSRENILKAKEEIFTRMTDQGLAVLNGDDPLLRTVEGTIAPRVVYCGSEEALTYRADHLQQLGAEGMECVLHTPRADARVTIPALGRHMIYPVLTACAIGEHFGLTEQEIAQGIADFVPTEMRMNVVQQGGVTILDDAYNANPQSMYAALDVLSHSGGSSRVAVLGDMFELGSRSAEMHRNVGKYAATIGDIDVVMAVGEFAQHMAAAAHAAGGPHVCYAKDKEEAKTQLASLVKPGAVLLVKASRGMEFEDLVQEIQRLAPED